MAVGFEFRCEGVYGLTGSGKTTFAMMRAFEASMKGLHVYTNVRFSRPALRHHLLRRCAHKYRDDAGNIPRLHKRWTYLEDDQVPRFWEHVYRGPALIMIDEAHLHFPQTKQMHGESADFLKYLTQHRKLLHHVMFLSQFNTLVSHSFRKLQHMRWEVKNTRQMAINLGLVTMRVPFEGFSYAARYRDDDKGPLVDHSVILACLPAYRWIWDLFDSRELHAGLESVLGASRQ